MTFEIVSFLFVLAIVYGALEVASIFKNKGAKFIISIAIGYFAATNEQVIQFLNQVLPYAIGLFVVIFILAFVFRIVKKGKNDWGLTAAIISLILILVVRLEGKYYSFLKNLPISESNFIVIVLIVGFLALLYAAYSRGNKQ